MGLVQPSPTPSYFSLENVKQICSALNELFQQNRTTLRLELTLYASLLIYNHNNWRKSTIPGRLLVLPNSRQQPDYNLELSVEGIYQIYDTMKHLKKSEKLKSRIGRHSRQLSEGKEDSTPGTPGSTPKMASYIDPQEGNQCCICLNSFPTCALPCSHMFCDGCTVKYIIEMSEKKCPICRQLFQGTSEEVSKQVYTVIQQEEQVMEQIRFTILGVLNAGNQESVKDIREELRKLGA